MEISTDFVLPLPPDAGYRLLLDLERVAPCMPGASLEGEREDGSRGLSVAVRLGPMKFNYGGTVRISERDDAIRRAVLVGNAKEKRGQGSARATITMTVAEAENGHSRVESQAVFELTGRAAQTGRGIVEDVARKMVDDMAACLAKQTATPSDAGAQTSGAAAPNQPASAPNQPASTPSAASSTQPSHASAPPQAPSPRAGEIRAGSLMWSVLKARIRRLWQRLGRRPTQ